LSPSFRFYSTTTTTSFLCAGLLSKKRKIFRPWLPPNQHYLLFTLSFMLG
jgi:hypothetical protein